MTVECAGLGLTCHRCRTTRRAKKFILFQRLQKNLESSASGAFFFSLRKGGRCDNHWLVEGKDDARVRQSEWDSPWMAS